MLFGSGYLANVGVLTALGGAGQTIFSDALNHASIIDGCRLARAETFVYEHCNLDHLEWALREHGREGDVIVTDSVFSMDGDVAPLRGNRRARAPPRRAGRRRRGPRRPERSDPAGAAPSPRPGSRDEVDVIVGTLSKALGSYGGYVCASARDRRAAAQQLPAR